MICLFGDLFIWGFVYLFCQGLAFGACERVQFRGTYPEDRYGYQDQAKQITKSPNKQIHKSTNPNYEAQK